jgi:Glycosyl hydrolases family 2, sugar binding domain/Glycoside hydrolase family 2 C-terminal domain 5/Glycosyl hydrolases family 2
MRNIFLYLLLLFCVGILSAQNKSYIEKEDYRFEKTINSQWTFNYSPGEVLEKGFELSGFDDSRWPALSLPHYWNTYESTGELHSSVSKNAESDNQYWCKGWGWYRKHFSINKDFSDKKVFIVFDGVRSYYKVWINGVFVGDQKFDDGLFYFDITSFLKHGEDNLLVMAVNNIQNCDNKLLPSEGAVILKKAGIYGDVKLILTDKLYIPLNGLDENKGGVSVIASQLSGGEADLTVNTWIKNDYPVKKSTVLQTIVTDSDDKIVKVIKNKAVVEAGQLFMFDQVIKSIKRPVVWSEDNPYHYNIYSEVSDNKKLVNVIKNTFGIKPGKDGVVSVLKGKSNTIIGFEDILTNNNSKNREPASQTIEERDPARILLTSPEKSLIADRGTVIVITADIIDSEGKHVKGANNTVKWNVTGEATLVGPDVYESAMLKHDQLSGGLYSEMPVSNLIRSSGRPGKINISVSASGLASGLLEIVTEVKKQDSSIVIEPEIFDEGREAIVRTVLKSRRLLEAPREIQLSDQDFKITSPDKQGYSKKIQKFILSDNSSVDPGSVEFSALIDLFGSHLYNNDGSLSADDYNFNVSHYNNCRLIAGYINSTRLPLPFKDGLRKYYSDAMIMLGSEKDAGDEMNWLNWIPSGGSVIIFQDKPGNSGQGVKVTNESELPGMIEDVYPVFRSFSDVAKKRAFVFISKMNPFIKVSVIDADSRIADTEVLGDISYKAEKGKPILIPDLKFISE